MPIPGLPPTTILRNDTIDPRKRRTRDKLIAAALDLVERQGFATLLEIAERAAVNKTTIRNHWAALLEEAGLVEERRDLPRGKATQETIVAVRPPLELCQG